MDITAFIFGGFRVFFGFLLLVFIPGFLITQIFFPRPGDLRPVERLAYSLVLSIGSVLIFILFMDVYLGIDTTPVNVVLGLIGFSLILVNALIARWVVMRYSVTEKIYGQAYKTGDGIVRPVRETVDKVRKRVLKTEEPRDRDEL